MRLKCDSIYQAPTWLQLFLEKRGYRYMCILRIRYVTKL